MYAVIARLIAADRGVHRGELAVFVRKEKIPRRVPAPSIGELLAGQPGAQGAKILPDFGKFGLGDAGLISEHRRGEDVVYHAQGFGGAPTTWPVRKPVPLGRTDGCLRFLRATGRADDIRHTGLHDHPCRNGAR